MYINKKTFAQVCCMLCLVLISFPSVSQDLQKRMSRAVQPQGGNINPAPQSTTASTVNAADGAAEVTLPNIASGGFNIIPTPSFIFTQIHRNERTGFSATMWGNALGTDSSMAFVKNKLLNPRLSIFGLQAEWNYQPIAPNELMAINFVAQANFLLKKIAYFDTSSKINTNITPFVVQPKLGISTAFFKNKVFFGAYYNILYVTTENDAFAKFFATEKKSLFSFPEINFGGYFDISDTKSIKVELDFIGNTSDTKRIYDNADKGIWFLKLGFKSAL